MSGETEAATEETTEAATEETTEEVAGAILDGLEYLVREAHAAGLRDLAKALTGVMLSPGHWPQPGRG